MGTAILLASYGSRHPRSACVCARVEARVHDSFPGLPVFWAVTSKNVRRAAGSDSPDQALARIAQTGVTSILVQALHIAPGAEYEELLNAVELWRSRFAGVAIGAPLLSSQGDIGRVAQALCQATQPQLDAGRAVVFMGHGSASGGHQRYAQLAVALRQCNDNLMLGTLEGHHNLSAADATGRTATAHALRDELLARGLRRVTLRPLLFHAGMHAENDLAGDKPASWLSIFSEAGLDVDVHLSGAAEDDALLDIWLDHLHAAAVSL